jgi:hypothetical protein
VAGWGEEEWAGPSRPPPPLKREVAKFLEIFFFLVVRGVPSLNLFSCVVVQLSIVFKNYGRKN